jgi:hypothetical protein
MRHRGLHTLNNPVDSFMLPWRLRFWGLVVRVHLGLVILLLLLLLLLSRRTLLGIGRLLPEQRLPQV